MATGWLQVPKAFDREAAKAQMELQKSETFAVFWIQLCMSYLRVGTDTQTHKNGVLSQISELGSWQARLQVPQKQVRYTSGWVHPSLLQH